MVKLLGRIFGVLIMAVAGIITFSTALTAILYFTPVVEDMPIITRIFSFVVTGGFSYLMFLLTRLGYRLYKKSKPVTTADENATEEANVSAVKTDKNDSTEYEGIQGAVPKEAVISQKVVRLDFGEEKENPVSKESNCIKLFSMWESSILYCDGWYILWDGHGNCSVISKEQARAKELGYVSYQASQDINRGGMPDEVAYRGRGLKKILDKNGHFERFELINPYCVDKITGTPVEMRGTIVIPDNIGGYQINQVCDDAFCNCEELEKVVLPDSIKTIGRRAFCGCTGLREINIPKGIKNIGDRAFEGTHVFEKADEVNISGHTLVKAGKELSGTYIVPENVTVIAERAFEKCTGLKEIIVHDGVTNIGMAAFDDCTSLEKIKLPTKIQSLGAGAFMGCSSLKSVVIPNGVTVLAHFADCTSLREVSIPASVECIQSDCFKNTGILNDFYEGDTDTLVVGNWLIDYKVNAKGEVTVSEGVIGIADQEYLLHSSYHCADKFLRLTTLNLPESLLFIGDDAFSHTGIEEVYLPKKLIQIDKNAFRATKLKTITIPASVLAINNWAFMDCRDLERIVFEGNTEPKWPAITGRGNGKTMEIVAPLNSPAHKYVQQYGKKYDLQYVELEKKIYDEPVSVEDNRIILHGETYFKWYGEHKTNLEKQGAIKLTEKTPGILLYEDDRLVHEYVLSTTGEEDFSGKYFIYGVRMNMVGNPMTPIVQIDGFVADSPDVDKMGSNTGYRFEGYNPYFGGAESARRRAAQADKDLIEKGLKYPGYITPSNVRLVGICSNCGKSLTFIGYNYPAMNAVPLYSDDGLSVEPCYDYDFDREKGVMEKDGKKFRYYNSLRCKYCGHPYIDYEHYHEMKQYGNLGCVYVE